MGFARLIKSTVEFVIPPFLVCFLSFFLGMDKACFPSITFCRGIWNFVFQKDSFFVWKISTTFSFCCLNETICNVIRLSSILIVAIFYLYFFKFYSKEMFLVVTDTYLYNIFYKTFLVMPWKQEIVFKGSWLTSQGNS